MAVNEKDDDVNGLGGDDYGLFELEKIGRASKQRTQQLRELHYRRTAARSDLKSADIIQDNIGNFPVNSIEEREQLTEFAAKKRARAEQALASIAPRITLARASKRDRLNQQAVNAVTRAYSESAINGDVAASHSDPEVQLRGTAMTGHSWEELSAKRAGIMSNISTLRDQNTELAQVYLGKKGVNPNIQAKFTQDSETMRNLVGNLGPITAAMKQLKQQGLDPESRQQELLHMGQKAHGIISYNSLEDQLKKGEGPYGGLSDKDLRKKETEAAQKLVKALDELRASAGKTKDELEGLNKSAEESAKELEEISEVRKMNGNGGRDGGGAALAAAGGQFANLIGNAIQAMAINQPMAQMGNVAGYANIENQKYDMFHRAVGGDMTARLNLGGWKNAASFGRSMGNRAGWVVGSRIVGGALDTTAGGLQSAEAIGQDANPVGWVKGDATHVQNTTAALLKTGEGLAGTLISGKDALQHISTSQAEIAGNQQAMDTSKALNHISGYQLQQYRDYMMGVNATATNMGGKAEDFINNAGGAGFMKQMQGVGLGMGEFSQLSQQGVRSMGSMFTEDQALKAKDYENRGLGNASDVMGRMASLGTGRQNPLQSMDKVMEQAVAKGISSSKALDLIAEHTGTLVQQTVDKGSGLDFTDSISRQIISAIDAANPNQELAVRQAAQTYQAEEGYRTDTSAGFSGQINVARVSKGLNLGTESSLAFARLSSTQMRGMASKFASGAMSQTDVARELENMGVDVRGNKFFQQHTGEFLNKGVEYQVLAQMGRGGMGFATGAAGGWQNLVAAMKGDKTGGVMKAFLGQTDLSTVSNDVGSQILNVRRSIGFTNGNISAVARDLLVGEGLLGINDSKGLPTAGKGLTAGQAERARGENQRTAAALAAAGGLTGTDQFTGTAAFEAVNDTGAVAQAQGGGLGGEGSWATDAAKAAESLGESAKTLDGASGKLVEAATALLTTAGALKYKTDDAENDKNRLFDQMPTPMREKLLKYTDGAH